MQLNKPTYDPYESTYIGHYKWPGDIQEQLERRMRIEHGVGTQCSPESFVVNYKVFMDRTTIGIVYKADIFETTTPVVPVPLVGYSPDKKYVKKRFGRPRPARRHALRGNQIGYPGGDLLGVEGLKEGDGAPSTALVTVVGGQNSQPMPALMEPPQMICDCPDRNKEAIVEIISF